MTPVVRRPWSLWLVVGILLLLALGALPAGYSMIVEPDGAGLGMTDAWLAGSPFPSFFVPGLFLFTVVGLGGLFTAIVLLVRPRWGWAQRLNPVPDRQWAWTLGLAMGIFLMAWIAVQVLSLAVPSLLQPAVFACGLLIVLLMATPAMRRYFAA